MTRSRSLTTTVALTAALVAPLLVAGPAAATVSPSAERQHAARAVSLVGTDLHLQGKVVPLPAAAGARPVLLGTVRGGWVVAAAGTFRLVRPDGSVRTIAGRDRTDPEVSESLADDGGRIVSSAVDQAEALRLRVVDLGGRVVLDGWYPHLRGDVLDAGDGKVYVGGRGGLSVLEEGVDGARRVLRRPTGLVALEHDLVFVSSRSSPGRFGPTRLSEPRTPPWRVRFAPVAVSPDGRYVLGREGAVRAMGDGHVVRRVPDAAPGDAHHFLGWASGARVLLETTVGRHRVLVSCPVPRGDCRRAGTTRGLVSLPTSHAGPYRQPWRPGVAQRSLRKCTSAAPTTGTSSHRRISR